MAQEEKKQYFKATFDQMPIALSNKVTIEIDLQLAAKQKGGRQFVHGALIESVDDIVAIITRKQMELKQSGLAVPDPAQKEKLSLH